MKINSNQVRTSWEPFVLLGNRYIIRMIKVNNCTPSRVLKASDS